jgi:hypothetical protein
MPAGGNFAFEGNMYIQALGNGGCKVALQAPSGAYVMVQANGPTGYDTMLQTGINAGSYGTQVGTGVYAGIVNAIEAICLAGSVRSAAGCTGPVLIGILPVTGGHTMVIMPGSNMFIFPST